MDTEKDQAVTLPEEQPSSKSSTADEASSIEALNWSDFEEDEPLSGLDTALLQSIHSILSDVGEGDGGEGHSVNNLSTSASSQRTVLNDLESEVTVSLSLDGEVIAESAGRQGTKRKREESPTTLTVPISNEGSGDLSSNAAVLDDGPIWAKGSKRYKFEENRRVNQKLTFGVLLSVVLAMGLGLGNLVAYNECEAEHRATDVPCPSASKSASPEHTVTPPLPAILPTSSHSPVPTPDIPSPMIEPPELAKASRPMVDPKYAQHAEELSRVLKMLDELSRKIDRFENTTRQLGGIVMMRDDIKPREPPTKKTKFLQLLAELMESKKGKKGEAKGHVKTWKDKKEEVLEEIAGAVLEAMQDDEPVEEVETFFEEGQTFSLDESETVSRDTEAQESLQASSSLPEAPSDFVIEPNTGPTLDKIRDESIGPQLQERLESIRRQKVKNGKNARDNKKLKRGNAVDLEEEFVFKKKDPKDKKEKDGKHHKLTKEHEEESRKNKKQSASRKQDAEGNDWSTVRAQNREENRRASEEREKRFNWQAERSRSRAEFRRTSKS